MHIKICDYCKIISKNNILSNINIDLVGGNIYGFHGKNGSGKTMLMRAISGLINPTRGSIMINEKTMGKDFSFPDNMGILIENPGFIESLSGIKNLKLLANINKKIEINKIIELMQLLDLDPYDNKKVKKYSLGMKQKLGIIAAVMENPDLIILDEPFNALDEKSEKKVTELLLKLKKEGKLIITSCHNREELEYLSDIIFFIEDGCIINTIKLSKKGENNEKNTYK